MTKTDDAIKQLCGENRDVLESAFRQMKMEGGWSLNSVCLVIDARRQTRVIQTTIGGVNGVITVSSASDHPLVQRWLALVSEMGDKPALDVMMNGDDGEEFCDAFEALKEERKERGQCLWTMTDCSEFVLRSKDAHAQGELSCIAVLPGSDKADWQMATFNWVPN